MPELRGFAGDELDGSIRLYRQEDAHSFVDLATEDLLGADEPDERGAATFRIRDGAPVQEGQLDDAEFFQLFAGANQADGAYPSFYCETKFWQCQHSKAIC